MSDEDASEILAAMKMHPTSPDPDRSELLSFAQQFLDIVKSLNSAQSAPAVPAATDEVEAKDPPARASKLEFKAVNEVLVFVASPILKELTPFMQLGRQGI
jgi:hypothetical protein